MKPLSFAMLFLVIMIPLTLANNYSQSYREFSEKNERDFNSLFQSAVDDTGVYMAQLESQQLTRGIRYTKESELTIHMNTLEIFYSNLALKFGVEGDNFEIMNIMLHIPAMMFIEHDGYRLITLTGDGNTFIPSIGPKKQFYYTTSLGYVVYFTTGDDIVLFDPNGSGQYLEGDVRDIMTVRNLAPISDYSTFNTVKSRVMVDQLKEEMGKAIEIHNALVNKAGVDSTFHIPVFEDDFEIKGAGFYAFIQGYPMPGGELSSAYALGSSEVGLRDTYTGVILPTGRHIAYGTSCIIPPDALVVESLFNDQEAARKGYFPLDCD